MTNQKKAKIWVGIGAILVTLAAIGLMAKLWREGRAVPAAPKAVVADGTPRIVSMAPNLTEILYAMGLEEHIIAVSSDSDYPAEARELPKIGTFWQPDLEAVIALRPSLVVTLGFQQQKEMAGKLRSVGIDALTVNIESIADLMAAIEKIGEATEKPEAAEALVARLHEQIRGFREQYAGRQSPRVLWVIQRTPMRVAGVETFATELLEIVGAQNAIGPTLHQYPPVDAEQVLAARPDIIIEPVEESGVNQRAQAREFYSRFKSAPAVRNGRICLVDADMVSRLGPRLGAGLRLIAELIWPEERGDEGT